MNLTQFLQALSARRKAFVITLAAVICTAIAVALIVPKKYVSTATLLMDARDEQTLSATRGMTTRDRAGYLATQMDLIKSGRVGAQVVRELKLAQKPGVREKWEAATGGVVPLEDWLATALIDRIRVDAPSGNILTIQASSNDPKLATAVANAFAKAYIDTTLALRTEPSREAAEWFEGQLKTLRAQLSESHNRIAGIQKA